MSGSSTPDKIIVHGQCVLLVQQRIGEMERRIADLAESVANETKSTAGDKYETARAMLHIEQDQIRRQLAEARAQLAVLQQLDPANVNVLAAPGSLVELTAGWFYLSTSLGKLQVQGMQVVAISMQSPLAEKLRGMAPGAQISMNGKLLELRRIL